MSPLDSSPDSDLIRFWFRLGLSVRSLFMLELLEGLLYVYIYFSSKTFANYIF